MLIASRRKRRGVWAKAYLLDMLGEKNAQKLIESRAVENWGNRVKLYEKKNLREHRPCRKPLQATEMGKDSEQHILNSSDHGVDKTPECTEDAVSLPKTKPLSKDGEKETVVQLRGKYLQQTNNADQFLLTDKLTSVPILKSASQRKLKPIRKGAKKIDLMNTNTSFDSIFQLMLTVSFDSPLLLQNLIQANDETNPFMKMLHDTHYNKITMATYQQRADILCDIFIPQGHPEIDCFVVECETTVATMCRKMFKNLPCFVETSKCTTDRPVLVKYYPLLGVDLAVLTSAGYNEEIEDQICVESIRKCPTDNCKGLLTTHLKTTG